MRGGMERPVCASTRRAWDERIAGQWQRPRVLTWHHHRASSLKMLGLSLWEGRLPGQKTIENEDKAAMVLTGQKVTLAQATPHEDFTQTRIDTVHNIT